LRGFILLGGGLKVEHASPAAGRILGCWFDEPASRLPALLEEWLQSDARGNPLTIERNGKRFVVEAPTAHALVVSEERVIPGSPSLTAREREVLRSLAAGKSTGEIAAELWVTPATVSKHLHHIYRKLGVTSRTAALAVVGTHQPAEQIVRRKTAREIGETPSPADRA
jgi:DNA-binding CsgD family transcriptional regulator